VQRVRSIGAGIEAFFPILIPNRYRRYNAYLRIEQRVKCGQSLWIFSADLTGKMRMRISSQPLQTAMSSLCALCQPLPLSFVDADDDFDDF